MFCDGILADVVGAVFDTSCGGDGISGGGTGISRTGTTLGWRGTAGVGDVGGGAEGNCGDDCNANGGCNVTAGAAVTSDLANHHAAVLVINSTVTATPNQSMPVVTPWSLFGERLAVDAGEYNPGSSPKCRSFSAFFSASRIIDMTLFFRLARSGGYRDVVQMRFVWLGH